LTQNSSIGGCMAPKRASNPGKTSRYYQSKKGRKSYNSTAAKRQYRKLLAAARRKRGIMGKGGPDVSHKGNRLKLEIPKKNRARGGAKRK